MSTINLAGLLIYRISPRKPIEYLLLNDSYEHHRHWYPPKGRKIGAEDELKCALRESLDLIGLSASDLVTDEAFRAELKYVDGIKPKQVVYFLARMSVSSRQGMIRCDSSGLKYQWCTLDQALERVMFQSMQNILTQAEDYIEGLREEILFDNSRPRWQTVGGDNNVSRVNRNNSNSNISNSNNNNRQYEGKDVNQDDGGAGGWRTQRGGAAGIEGNFKKLAVSDGQRTVRRFNDREQQDQQNKQDQQNQLQNQGQQSRPQDNPRYKTKLCEKFEREGECPYHHKCVFAHGESEMRVCEVTPTTPSFKSVSEEKPRERPAQSSYQQQPQYNQQQQPQQIQRPQQLQQKQPIQQGFRSQQPQFFQAQSFQQQSPNQNQNQSQSQSQSQQPRTPQGAAPKFNDNPLYKTRPCQRFAEQGACPYGEKCQFAHGDVELRVTPEQPVQVKSPRDVQYTPRTTNDQGPNGFNRNFANQSQTWRKGGFEGTSERAQIPNFARNASWSNTTNTQAAVGSPSISDEGSLNFRFAASAQSPTAASGSDSEFKAPLAAPIVTPVPQKIPTPSSAKAVPTGTPVKRQQETVKPGSLKKDASGEKPWIKVLEVNDQVLQQMGSPLADSAASNETPKQKQISKTIELENRLTKELIESFAKASVGDQEPTLQAAFKEITHTEFRNNLGKQQLLNVAISALFAPCKAVGVSETVSRKSELLSKIVTKPQDQALMLNSWQRLLADDEHAAAWQKKASEVLGALYKASLLDEDVFTAWFTKKNSEDRSPAISAMEPFANWLATAEEE